MTLKIYPMHPILDIIARSLRDGFGMDANPSSKSTDEQVITQWDTRNRGCGPWGSKALRSQSVRLVMNAYQPKWQAVQLESADNFIMLDCKAHLAGFEIVRYAAVMFDPDEIECLIRADRMSGGLISAGLLRFAERDNGHAAKDKRAAKELARVLIAHPHDKMPDLPS